MATSVTMNDNILPNSKKIIKFKKLNPTPSSKKECEFNDKDANCKKYETFNNNQKMGILTDLKKGLMQICKLEYEEKESFVDDLLELLPVVDLKEYNKLLGRVLTKHIDSFVTSPKILTQWRKKIKGWIHNTGKPENRGNPLVPFEKLDTFRNEVIRILKNLPFRCFPLLRQNILKVLERFHKEDEIFNGPQPFNTNVCSKHWWFNFMQRNQDIKTMWESIPLEREGKKLKAHAQKQQEEKMSMKIEEEEGKEEEPAPKTSSLHMADPIFSGPPAFMPPPQTAMTTMTTMPTMSTMPTLPLPTLSALPRLFAPVSFPDTTNKAAASRVPDPYFVSMKALEFLFASRDALKKSLVEINQSQNQNQANNQQTEMKTEENGVKEEINVKIQPFVEKEEDVTDSTKISPNNEMQTVKAEETRVKIEVEALPATMESESSDIKQADS